MAEMGRLPTVDWLSETRAGAHWLNFEWASQILYDALLRSGGLPLLWLFKAALMAASAWILLRTLKLYEASVSTRWAALALWSAASLTRSDIRPELFSLIGFGLTFLLMERRRLGRRAPHPFWLAPVYCLWANLHPGFLYGFALIGIYAAVETAERQGWIEWQEPRELPNAWSPWLYLSFAVLGSFFQLYGVAAYQVAFSHYKDIEHISAHISEWSAIRLDNPWHWPFWFALFSAFGAALLLVRRKRWLPLGPLGALFFFGFSASEHSRMAAYFIACAVPLIAHFLIEADAVNDETPQRWLKILALAAFGGFAFFCARMYGFPAKLFNDRFVPARASEFLDRHSDVLLRKNLYNPWGWGGYIGWRLYPKYLIFQDGRYIFHDLLREAGQAIASPADWQRFLDRHRIDLALMENIPLRHETSRVYPDGSIKIFKRPYYLAYMPRQDWALVYWDERALLFARRTSVPADWLKAREYRWLRPYDEEAFADARARGEIPMDELHAESVRRERELAELTHTVPSRL